MYRILLPTDSDDQRARRVAEAIVDLPGDPGEIKVTILNVFEEFEVTDEGPRVSSDNYFDESDFPDSVDEVTEIFTPAGIESEKRREHGDPTETILAVAEEIDADLIAIGGRKRSPAGKVLFGSVTQSVLISSDRPVLVAMDD